MIVETQTIQLQTRGNGEVHDITRQVAAAIGRANGGAGAGSNIGAVGENGLRAGTVTIFCPSATSALTTLEYESGCISDLQRLFDEIVDPDRHYAHNARWGDGNGHSHVRAALLGPSLTVPFVDGRLTLGTWQQIIFVDFDNRARRRELVVQIMGQ